MSADNKLAHFYAATATSTFLVIRRSCNVEVIERGKNEKPNEKGSFFQRLRNLLVAIPAMLGLAKPQWKMLTAGILKTAQAELWK